jgi:ASC-1-like (ASCH) protein
MNIKHDYVKHLSEPWFSLISLGLKTVEGRKNKGDFNKMEIGDIVKWTNDDFKSRHILTKIVGKKIYKTFEEYLKKEGLQKSLPGMPSL